MDWLIKKKKIIGVFTSWEKSVLDKPENVLRKNLEKNPTYPFHEVEPNVYVFTVRSGWLVLAVILCLVTLITTVAVYAVAGGVDQSFVFAGIVFLGFLQMAFYHRRRKTYVLDGNRNMYEFYKGEDLIYTGNYHNVYIRLKGQKSGTGDTYFNVVLDGFLMDEESISSSTLHHKKLGRLGRRLAQNLNLNFFDYTDKSRHHIIRHRCPYRSQLNVNESSYV